MCELKQDFVNIYLLINSFVKQRSIENKLIIDEDIEDQLDATVERLATHYKLKFILYRYSLQSTRLTDISSLCIKHAAAIFIFIMIYIGNRISPDQT